MKTFRLLILTIVVLCTGQLSASHLLGGEIYWRCNPNGTYRFTLVVYRDCTGIQVGGVNGTETIDGPAGAINVTYVSSLSGDVSPPCPDPNFILTCAAEDDGAIEKHVWEGNTTLNGTPPATGWEFSWSDNARPTLENAQGNTSYYLRSVMYPYTPPGASAPLNTNTCYDNSPTFAQDANAITCPDFKYTFNHLPADKDVDSLVFGWAVPKNGANTNITWSGGYGSTAPFPDQTENPSNGPNTLDPQSGEMTIEAYSPADGWYASCVSVKEYRCGQLIGEVFRDVPIHFLDIQDCQANASTPTAEIDTAVYKNVKRTGNVYNIKVYPQDTVLFRLTGKDLDQFSNGFFQEICMKAGGLQINTNNYASSTGCNGAAPCATLTSVNPNNSYCNTIQNTVEFFWVPDCVHLNSGSCGSANNKYFFTIRMQDNGCAAPKIGLASVIVEVIAGDPTPPKIKCANVRKDGNIDLSWGQPELDSVLEFNYYRIYGSNSPNGPWSVVDSIPHYDTLSTVVPSMGPTSYFYMEWSTGPCDFISQPSDTLRTMTMTMTAIPPGSPEYAQLAWSPFDPNGLPSTTNGVYEIWVEAPANSGNWQKAGETTTTSYVDTVSVCDMQVAYQIRVQDTASGCYSGSSQDTGTFKDLTNSVNPNVTRVYVDSTNKAAVEFPTDSVGDIVEYYLLFNDPKDGWVVVDTIAGAATSPYVWDGSMADMRSEEFKVISVDSCGNQSDDLAVSPNNTVYLRNYLDKCNGTSRLSWNAYNEFPNGVHGYRVYVEITEDNGTVIPQYLLFTAEPEDTTYLQTTLQSGYQYCYVVEAFDTTAGLTSTSNELCVQAEVPQQSRELYIASVSNDPRRRSIDLKIVVDGEADVRSYQLERAPDLLGPYRTIANISKPNNPPYIIEFQDFGVEPKRLEYYYRVSATDSCGGRDTVSNISKNLVLKVSPKEDLTNRLSWPNYRGWNGTVDRYEVYRATAEAGNYQKIADNDGNDTTFIDFEIPDLVRANPDNGKFCYYIKAVETGNPLITNTGDPYSALSNESCVNQKVRIYMATAFRPNSNVPENRLFGPSMELGDVDQYRFYIMNRWGKKVFDTTDPTERWDGTDGDGEAPQGVYIYYVKYATPGDKSTEERGNFSLIR